MPDLTNSERPKIRLFLLFIFIQLFGSIVQHILSFLRQLELDDLLIELKFLCLVHILKASTKAL